MRRLIATPHKIILSVLAAARFVGGNNTNNFDFKGATVGGNARVVGNDYSRVNYGVDNSRTATAGCGGTAVAGDLYNTHNNQTYQNYIITPQYVSATGAFFLTAILFYFIAGPCETAGEYSKQNRQLAEKNSALVEAINADSNAHRAQMQDEQERYRAGKVYDDEKLAALKTAETSREKLYKQRSTEASDYRQALRTHLTALIQQTETGKRFNFPEAKQKHTDLINSFPWLSAQTQVLAALAEAQKQLPYSARLLQFTKQHRESLLLLLMLVIMVTFSKWLPAVFVRDLLSNMPFRKKESVPQSMPQSTSVQPASAPPPTFTAGLNKDPSQNPTVTMEYPVVHPSTTPSLTTLHRV